MAKIKGNRVKLGQQFDVPSFARWPVVDPDKREKINNMIKSLNWRMDKMSPAKISDTIFKWLKNMNRYERDCFYSRLEELETLKELADVRLYKNDKARTKAAIEIYNLISTDIPPLAMAKFAMMINFILAQDSNKNNFGITETEKAKISAIQTWIEAIKKRKIAMACFLAPLEKNRALSELRIIALLSESDLIKALEI